MFGTLITAALLLAAPREFPCEVSAAHDGDTVTVSVDLGLRVWLRGEPLRLYGVNCPELPTPAGVEARNFTRAWLGAHLPPHTLIQAGDGRDKYGRLLGRLKAADGHVLNDDLLTAGMAVVLKD